MDGNVDVSVVDGGDLGNLTELERVAVRRGINVADGHARYEPSSSQQKILDRLPELFALAAEESEMDLDREAQVAFLTALGQHTATTHTEALTCYSSSVAAEIFGRALYTAGMRRVAMIHPTFDNIPDILKGVGLGLHPVDEERVHDGSAELPPDIDVLFITTPNNPTGKVLQPHLLRHWAQTCASRGILLALDTSFRGFDRAAQYDHYAVLAEAGCRYVVIEDTGKLWPTLDLKVGILAFPRADPLPLHRIHTDILLGVSPLILMLVRQFAEDAAAGGFDELYRLVARNRRTLCEQVDGVSTLWFPDPDSRISVLRLGLPADSPATQMWRDLRGEGVHVLPCRQFFWAHPPAGERFVRVALGRPTELVRRASVAIRRYCETAGLTAPV